MAECLHLDESGRRCRREAEARSWFCGDHSPQIGLEPRPLAPAPRKFFLRLAAVFLLAVFLGPLLLQWYQLLMAWLN